MPPVCLLIVEVLVQVSIPHCHQPCTVQRGGSLRTLPQIGLCPCVLPPTRSQCQGRFVDPRPKTEDDCVYTDTMY